MRQSAAIRVWDGLWLALALIPLAIFWSGRDDVFRPAAGADDETLAAHLGASAVYIVAVACAQLWFRGPWRRRLPVRALGFAASVASAVWFTNIGGDVVGEAPLAGLGIEVAIILIVWGAACNAAWIVLWWIAAAIRRWRAARSPNATSLAAGRTTRG